MVPNSADAAPTMPETTSASMASTSPVSRSTRSPRRLRWKKCGGSVWRWPKTRARSRSTKRSAVQTASELPRYPTTAPATATASHWPHGLPEGADVAALQGGVGEFGEQQDGDGLGEGGQDGAQEDDDEPAPIASGQGPEAPEGRHDADGVGADRDIRHRVLGQLFVTGGTLERAVKAHGHHITDVRGPWTVAMGMGPNNEADPRGARACLELMSGIGG